ncbi:MAG TPA: hypothetical protein VGM92_07800, partial [Candidatus Kapabacteria bacterium]
MHAQFLGQQSLSESSYVIDQSGNLWVWGRNDESQLGVGDRVDHTTPVMVPVPVGATRWTLVAGGANFALAVADSDKLYSWGVNDHGQLGIGNAGGDYGGPMRIPNPANVTAWKWITAGASHSVALSSDGQLFAWGDNSKGELGVGNVKFLTTPQSIEVPTGVPGWADVAAGPWYTVMLSTQGVLYGCGVDSEHTFTPFSTAPQIAQIDTFRAFSPLPCLAASNEWELRIDQVYYSPISWRAFEITPDHGSGRDLASVAAGGWHNVFVDMYGAIACAGDDTHGQVGT